MVTPEAVIVENQPEPELASSEPMEVVPSFEDVVTGEDEQAQAQQSAQQEEAQAQAEQAEAEQNAGRIPREVFIQMYKTVFNGLGKMGKYNSLTIHTNEEPAANACASALYDICTDVPWLNFLLDWNNIWLQRSLAIGAFMVPKAIAFAAEKQAKEDAARAAAARETAQDADTVEPEIVQEAA